MAFIFSRNKTTIKGYLPIQFFLSLINSCCPGTERCVYHTQNFQNNKQHIDSNGGFSQQRLGHGI